MAVAVSYPGVYIEEIPSGVRTITGVSTSVAAFVGYTVKGPLNQAVKVYNFGDFSRIFGGLALSSELGYALQQFFLNGGSEAWVIRVADSSAAASAVINDASGTPTLKVEAVSAGGWGNLVYADIDYATNDPEGTFNLTLTSYSLDASGSRVQARTESYPNLSLNTHSPRNAVSVVNAGSLLVRLTSASATTANAGFSLSTDLHAFAGLSDSQRKLRVAVDGKPPVEVDLFQAGHGASLTLAQLEQAIKSGVAGAGVVGFDCQLTDALGGSTGSATFLKLISPTHDDQSAVQVLPASTSDAAPILGLGVVNGGRERPSAGDLRPALTGTLSGDLSALLVVPSVGNAPITDLSTSTDKLTATLRLGTTTQATTGSFDLGGTVLVTLDDLAARLEAKLQSFSAVDPAFASTQVSLVGRQLRIVVGLNDDSANITFSDATGTPTSTLRLAGAGSLVNVHSYRLGLGAVFGAQSSVTQGSDGTPPTNATAILGDFASKTGIYALEDVDIFNLLCIPITSKFEQTSAVAVVSAAMAYCLKKRAFFLIDPPESASNPGAIRTFMSALTPDKNGALYFPMLQIADPLDGFRLRAVPPSGTLAGLFARIDGSRGVWKAPAGTEATLAGAQGLTYNLTDLECGGLNQLGIDCLRVFPVYGRVAWGARTLIGADRQASEWKYVPVRRTALYLEESLFRGTQWVVFEPNDEPLWSQIRLNLGPSCRACSDKAPSKARHRTRRTS